MSKADCETDANVLTASLTANAPLDESHYRDRLIMDDLQDPNLPMDSDRLTNLPSR